MPELSVPKRDGEGSGYEVNVNVRLSPVLLARLDALKPALEGDPRVAPRGRLSRSELFRAVLLMGIETAERRLGKGSA